MPDAETSERGKFQGLAGKKAKVRIRRNISGMAEPS